MKKNILLIGGGGHCRSVLDTIFELNEYLKLGIIDKKENIGKKIMGVSVIGCDDDLTDLFNNGYNYAFITVGSIGNPSSRIRLFEILTNIGYEIPAIIDSSAKISKYAKIEKGVFIGKLCIVNSGNHIKKGAIINTGSIIEHDCQISSFVHIAPGVVLGGGVRIGDNTHVGINTSVKQQVNIGSNSVIGMGSVVLEDVNNNTLAYGNPCKEVKKL